MRKYLGLAIVFAFVVSVGPALAGESFYALSPLPDAQLATLSPLPDAQLATIEGTDKDGHKSKKYGKYDGDVEVCIACFNIATVTQINVAVNSKDVDQLNAASVEQEIN
jgi:hypothetical protein